MAIAELESCNFQGPLASAAVQDSNTAMLATKHYRMKARTAELTVTVTAAKADAPRLGQPEQLHELEGLPNCDGFRVTKTGLQGLAVTLWTAPVAVFCTPCLRLQASLSLWAIGFALP